jgi:hypothetical protein
MPEDTRLELRQIDQSRTEGCRLLLTATIGTITVLVGALFLWFALATPMSGCPRWTVAAARREHQHAGHYYVPPSERGCEP